VTHYLLDTNIIRNATKPLPSSTLLTWMAEQVDDDLFISTLTLPKSVADCLKSWGAKSARCWKPGSPVSQDHRPSLQAASSLSTSRQR